MGLSTMNSKTAIVQTPLVECCSESRWDWYDGWMDFLTHTHATYIHKNWPNHHKVLLNNSSIYFVFLNTVALIQFCDSNHDLGATYEVPNWTSKLSDTSITPIVNNSSIASSRVFYNFEKWYYKMSGHRYPNLQIFDYDCL